MDSDCYSASCDNVTRPVYSKVCEQVEEEQCQVTIDTVWEDQCTDQETTMWAEQCRDVDTQDCVSTQQWVCADQDQYGAPQAPVIQVNRIHTLGYS